MKKRLFAVSMAALITTGCATNEVSDITSALQPNQVELTVVSDKSYQPSTIADIETVRSGINNAFLASQPAYAEYAAHLEKVPALLDCFSATEDAQSEEEKRSAFNLLSQENQDAVIQFINSDEGKALMASLGQAAKTAMSSIVEFEALDTQSLMANVGLLEIISEKDKISQTLDQIDYLNKTVVSAYNNYSQIAELVNAG